VSVLAESDVPRTNMGGREPLSPAMAVEEPLEIRLAWGPPVEPARTLAIVMRTPGDDAALAVGFLYGEGILRSQGDVEGIRHCRPVVRDDGTSNVIRVQLRRGAPLDLARLEGYPSIPSTVAAHGPASLDAVRMNHPPVIGPGPVVEAAVVRTIPRRLRRHEDVFDQNGELHVAALFRADGRLLRVREDVGRSNAVDKLIGAEFIGGGLPRSEEILFVSERPSFEVVRKALMASIPIVVAMGAPSALATALAREHGMTLLGFMRDGHFNVYSGAARVVAEPALDIPMLPCPVIELGSGMLETMSRR
jgi:FdhD protein